MQRQNTNGVIEQSQEDFSKSSNSLRNSKKSTKNWRVVPSNYEPPVRTMNGIHKPPKPIPSTNSLDPKNLVVAASLLGSVGSLKAAEVTEKLSVKESTSLIDETYKGFEFPFENLVLEGGGNKGMAYVGALQVIIFMLN